MYRPPRMTPVLALLLVGAAQVTAQQPSTGLEFNGLPALNYDSDEGFGYGVLTELYHYGNGAVQPYLWTLQPTVFLTTEGRRDLTVFFDSPALLGDGWRIDGFAGVERQIATPYYGIGNATPYAPALEDEPDPFYYRFGRERRSVSLNLQRDLLGSRLRLLFGAGMKHATLDARPEDRGSTLLERELQGAPPP